MTTLPLKQNEQEKRQSSEAGFSLVELMVVVFIMGLLATLIVVNVAPVGDQRRPEVAPRVSDSGAVGGPKRRLPRV